VQVEGIPDKKLRALSTDQFSDAGKAWTGVDLCGKNECLMVGQPGCKMKRRRYHIHLAISNQDISIAPKAPDTLVFMLILVIGVQKIAMADYKIKHRIRFAIRLLRISAEHVVDCSAIVKSGRYLTVAIEARCPSRIGEPLDLETLLPLDHPKIRVAIAATGFEMKVCCGEPIPKPILKVKLFVGIAYPADKDAFTNSPHAFSEYRKYGHMDCRAFR